ncbi:MAG: dihydroneopterin aldolase [Candidatus Eremiobacteraeota bacterium]|nr:dihydroneopterin aldolase [Candidatus Eremiobacteraeota bacterium]MBV8499516.1 dihydroneopterin aldolase [Candidatus Eremiobacteraeota bacterium]
MDRISLDGIRAYGKHGADAAERERAQPFDIAISAELDLTDAAATDDLSATLDYAALHERIVQIVATTSYALLERLAADLLDAVFEERRVQRARVTIAKPRILDGATPSVTLCRSR